MSIDIAEIDVGQNIGARLQADQAEADMRVAQAKAEERRAWPWPASRKCGRRSPSNRATVTLAEAEVPLALSAAFRQGNIEAQTRRPPAWPAGRGARGSGLGARGSGLGARGRGPVAARAWLAGLGSAQFRHAGALHPC